MLQNPIVLGAAQIQTKKTIPASESLQSKYKTTDGNRQTEARGNNETILAKL